MTVLKFTRKENGEENVDLGGPVATAAWAILASKYGDMEEIILSRNISKQESHDSVEVRLTISPDASIQSTVEQVERHASHQHQFKTWCLCLDLSLDAHMSPCSASMEVVVVETSRPNRSWQDLELPSDDSLSRLLLSVSPASNNAITFELQNLGIPSLSATHLQRMFLQFEHILDQLLNSPCSTTLGSIDLVSCHDKAEISSWNAAPVESDLQCLHWMIEAWARSDPTAEAICAWDGSLNYSELCNAADILAKELIALGVKAEVLVPVCFEKSVWAIVAMVAILKAGGAIVPLNPDHPKDRQLAILRDVQATIVLSSVSHEALSRQLHANVLVVGESTVQIAPPEDYASGLSPLVEASPQSPAFAVFTSGSTGQPKGIVIEHVAICTSIRDHGLHMRFGRHTRTIQFAAYTFDDSFSDIFTTLAFGGCICIPNEHDRLNDLAGSIVQLDANHACLTVTVANQLQPRDVPCLTTLVVGGENVTSQTLRLWAPHVYLINSYGPAEASIFCSANCGLSATDDASNIGIGVGCLLHITDIHDHNKLLPVGSVGELLIEGPILARGYINNKVKTEASFIVNPTWATPFSLNSSSNERRMYKTGDLARYHQDGTIQVLGRKDTQVKLHGQRIELGEIETHLRLSIPNCREVAAEILHIKVDTELTTPLIAAFLCMQQGHRLEVLSSHPHSANVEVIPSLPPALEEQLRKSLPSYMVPSAFILVSEMPLMVSGKLDRKRLRELASNLTIQELLGSEKQTDAHNAVTDHERTLQALWAQVLHMKPSSISLEDDFFRLGGDSISAMRLVAAAREMRVELTVQLIFQHPRLGEQSANMRTIEQKSSKNEQVARFALLDKHERRELRTAVAKALRPLVVEDIYSCSPLQSGIMSLSLKHPGSYVARMAYKLPEDIDIQRLKKAWESTVQSNSILRTRIFQSENDSRLWQVVVDETIHWLETNTELRSYLARDKEELMVPNSGLARYALVHSGPSIFFVWTLHHAIFDDESQKLILRTVQQMYEGAPAPVSLGFNVFIKHVTQADTDASATFWRAELDNAPSQTFPILPSSNHSPISDGTVTHELEWILPAGSDVTSSTLIRATWAILLSSYSDNTDVVFGCTVNGRTLPLAGVETTTGPTFATVPLRIKVDGSQRLSEFLATIQGQYASMIPHEQAGLQSIARWVPEAKDVCELRSLLVVQTEGEDSLFGSPELLGAPAGFLTNPLTIECRIKASKLVVNWHFDSQMLNPVEVERMSKQFEHILLQLSDKPSNSFDAKTINSLGLVSLEDVKTLNQWNSQGSDELEIAQLMHHGFHEQAQQNPSRVAAETYSDRITYGELEQASSRLAYALVTKHGIQIGDYLLLCRERSIATIVAALAILKSGGALVMLDPSLPPARLEYVAQLCKTKIILSSASTIHLASTMSIRAIEVEKELSEHCPAVPAGIFQVPVPPSAPACLMLTSGSTGLPKGTIISHQAWAIGLQSHAPHIGMSQLDPLRALHFAGLSFDAAMIEIFTTLSLGGCICILPDSERSYDGVARAINKLEVNWAYLSASFALLIDASFLPTLQVLFFGGEAPSPALFSKYPNQVQLIQGYGPSECTPVTFTNPKLDPECPSNIGRVMVGSSWLVDPLDHSRLAPIGAFGELVLAGPNIGDGYFGDANRTALSFVQPPSWSKQFPAIDQKRHMYLSGDLFRYAHDGTMIYCGRKDTQIKLRGQRIEVGEIERQLSSLIPRAKSVVVEGVIPAEQDRMILVAFLCLHSANSDTPNDDTKVLLSPSACEMLDLPEILRQAALFLPHYMIPAIFLPISRLPLMTTSRKIDRAKLRRVASSLSISELRAYTVTQKVKKSPRTFWETGLRVLFSKVLHLHENAISIDDSFLHLGGDSIDSMRLVSLAKREGLSMTVAQVLKHPVLADLAESISKNGERTRKDPVAVQPWQLVQDRHNSSVIRTEAAAQCSLDESKIEDAFPCTALQEGLFALSLARPGTYFSQHIFCAASSVDTKSYQLAWERLFDSLGIFRTRIIQLSTTELIQVVVKEQLEWNIETDLEVYLQHDKALTFSIGGRLGRFAMIQSHGSSPVVVWTAHHSVYDGVSVGLITSALEDLLQSEASHNGSSYGLKQSLNKDYAKGDFRQYIKYVGDAKTETAKDYWRHQFSNGNFVDLPFLPHENNHIERECLSESIPYTQNSVIGTMSATIRAAWALTMTRYTSESGAHDVVFGATVSGRDAPVTNIEHIVGPLISTVPIRVSVDYQTNIQDFVKTMQMQAVDMIEHQHYGMQNIRKVSESAEAACRFRSLLVVQSASLGKESGLVQHRFASTQAQTHTYPLVVDCDVKDASIDINALYDGLSVDPSLMQRVMKVFGAFISAITSSKPTTTISELLRGLQPDLQTLQAWTSQVPHALEECIHHIIPFQKCASQLAVSAWDGQFTYGELHAVSTRLAHHLLAQGVRSEILVPLCFHKSIWAVVAVLAVLKAGGAPVFLNSALSVDQLSTLIDFLEADILLSSRDMFLQAKPMAKITLEIDHSLVNSIPLTELDLPLPQALPHHMAFASFTSGTTGMPKCIILEHRNVSTMMSHYSTCGEFRPGARVLQFASHTFDAIIKDILATLLNGCTLYIPSDEDRMNNLIRYMQTHQITQATLTPTIGTLFAPSDVPSLEVLILAGEKMSAENLATWAPFVHLNNAYGPSETTGRATCHSGLQRNSDPSNIGFGVGCVCWLVDPNDHNLLVPIGATGEIVIEGPTVSRGYLKNPEKTANAYISSPDWMPAERRVPSNRLYKTGDLARFNLDGSLTIIGRSDAQVKLRGQRIQLEEVEAVFKANLPEAIGIVVEMVISKSTNEDQLLAAFLHDKTAERQPTDTLQIVDSRHTEKLAALDMHRIRDAASKMLAPYMMPTLFLVINSVPLMPSAKIDRRKLRTLYTEADPRMTSMLVPTNDAKPIELPVTQRQKRLRSAVSKVLRLSEDSISFGRSFTMLGGDSITAIRLVSVARKEAIGMTVSNILSAATLFELDSVATDVHGDITKRCLQPFELLQHDDKDRIVAEAAAQCDISMEMVEDVYPCSALQQALIALAVQQDGEYVAQRNFQLTENIDTAKLLDALNATAQKIPILRTRIVQTSYGLFQAVINENVAWYQRKVVHSSMALGRPLNRFEICPSTKTLTWTAHHATYDGATVPVVLQLVDRIYHDASVDSISFADYRLFIQHIMKMSVNDSKQYWSSYLAETNTSPFPSTTSIKDRINTSSHSRYTVELAGPPTSAILRTAWACILSAYTSTQDLVFGAVLSGRDSSVEQIENMVGPTIATVPIRVRLDWSEKLESHLERVRNEAVAMIPHEHFGLQNIQRLSEEIRQSCNFGSLLVVHSSQEVAEESSAMFRAEKDNVDSLNMNTYPLVLEIQITSTGYVLDLSHDSEIITSVQTERIAAQLSYVISQLVRYQSDPSATLHDIQIVSPMDLETVWTWNSTIPDTIHDTLHGVVARVTLHEPDRQAIMSWDGQMSYMELDQASSALALEIWTHDRSTESFVALCFEKSLWSIVAMLGVLKAGKAFAFFDATYPTERLQQMKNTLQPVLAISTPGLASRCQGLGIETIPLGPGTLDLDYEITDYNAVATLPSYPMCAIFTSGTTGVPKATVLPHKAYVTSNTHLARLLSITSLTRMLNFASYSFDASIFETLTTLMVGGCVCVADERFRNINLDREVTRMNVNTAVLTPAFVSILSPDKFSSLQSLVLAGEVATSTIVSQWSQRLALHNLYGPSECTFGSTLNLNLHPDSFPANIGHASCGATWIVDPTNTDRLMPIGAPGELLLEGPNIGIGYINDVSRTKAAFLDSPPRWWHPRKDTSHSYVPRFYRTGDFVRYDPDGSLVFLGRGDQQAKIRGQRVEMTDIENHMAGVQRLVHSIVLVPNTGPLRKRLVAVVSLHEGSNAEAGGKSATNLILDDSNEYIRSVIDAAGTLISEKLPIHMVPNFWVPVYSCPVLLSGKLDRKRVLHWLETLDENIFQRILAFSIRQEKDESLTSTELSLRTLWHQVLNLDIDVINKRSVFLQLGGDSISAMQLVSKARAVGLKFTVRQLLESKNLKELAQRATVTTHPRKLASNPGVETDKNYDLSPMQKLYFKISPEGDNGFEQSMLLRVTKEFSTSTMSAAFQQMVEHHPQLRARYIQSSGQWKQRISPYGPKPEVLHIHEVPYEAIRKIVSQSISRIDFQNGPVFAAELIKTERGQFIFVVAHHLSVDLVSWDIILQDLADLCTGRVATLSSQSLSFPIWCNLQNDYCQNNSSVPEFTQITPLDVDFWGLEKDFSNTFADIVYTGFKLDQITSTSILHDSNVAIDSKPVDIFLAAVITSFGRVFRERELPLICVEGHGREPWDSSIDILKTVGWFTTLWPIQIGGHDATDIAVAVRAVKQSRSRSVDNGFTSFACSQLLSSSAGYHPGPVLPEILFNYLGQNSQQSSDEALFRTVDMDLKDDSVSSQKRLSLLNISVQIREGKIHFDFSYNKSMAKMDLITQWVVECENCLREAAIILPSLSRHYLPSDFPLLQATETELDLLVETIMPSMKVHMEHVADMYACSPAQLEMLRAEEDAIGHHMMRINFRVRSSGTDQLDVEHLKSSFLPLVEHHSILRTVFAFLDGENGSRPVQLVLKNCIPTIVCDFDNDDETIYTDDVYQRLKSGKPPYRILIRGIPGQEHITMTFEISHALIDGASIAILLRDWSEAYQGRLSKKSPATQYSTLIRHLQQRPPQEAQEYWSQQFLDMKPCLVPTLTNNLDLNKRKQHITPLHLPPYTTLHSFCKEHAITLPNLLHAVWAISLQLTTQSTESVFAYLLSGRDMAIPGIEEAVGPYFNLLLSRYSVDATTSSVGSVLRMVQKTMTERLAYQDFSWPEMRGSRTEEACNTLVNIHHFGSLEREPGEDRGGLVFEAAGNGYDPLAYPLELNAVIKPHTFTAALTWWNTSFTESWILKFKERVETTVWTMVEGDLDIHLEALASRMKQGRRDGGSTE